MGGLSYNQPHSGRLRVPLLRRCWLKGPDVDAAGLVCNVSRTGTYVAIRPAPKVGGRVHLSFQLPWEDQPIEADAVVCWDNSDGKARGLPPGCGLEFQARMRNDRERLEALVRAFAARRQESSTAEAMASPAGKQVAR